MIQILSALSANSSMPSSPERFRLLATPVAGRAIGVAPAENGHASFTDGRIIYVSTDDPNTQRPQILVQSGPLGAGSLNSHIVKALPGRPKLAHRYLALQGRRVLNDLARTLPLAAGLGIDSRTSSSTESIEIASRRMPIE